MAEGLSAELDRARRVVQRRHRVRLEVARHVPRSSTSPGAHFQDVAANKVDAADRLSVELDRALVALVVRVQHSQVGRSIHVDEAVVHEDPRGLLEARSQVVIAHPPEPGPDVWHATHQSSTLRSQETSMTRTRAGGCGAQSALSRPSMRAWSLALVLPPLTMRLMATCPYSLVKVCAQASACLARGPTVRSP